MSNENEMIGEPVFGKKKFAKKVNAENAGWKLDKEGDHIYRILPPFGLLAKTGRWSFFESIHWGYKDSAGKHKPFRCVQRKNRKGMIEVECPQCKKIAERTEARANQEKKLLAEGKSKDETKELLKSFDAWISVFNTARGHYLNVLRRDQQIGKLFIKIKCMQALDAAIDKLMARKTPVNPISAGQGAWAVFTRTGTGRYNTEYTASFLTDTKEVEGLGPVDILVSAPLTPEVLARMPVEAFELSTGYRDLTYEEIQQLVMSDGDASIVDSIFGAPRVTTSEPTFNAEVPSDEPTSDATDSVMQQIAAIRSKSAVTSTPAVTKTDVSTKSSTINMDDFMNALK